MNVASVCFFLLNILVHNSKGQLPNKTIKQIENSTVVLEFVIPDAVVGISDHVTVLLTPSEGGKQNVATVSFKSPPTPIGTKVHKAMRATVTLQYLSGVRKLKLTFDPLQEIHEGILQCVKNFDPVDVIPNCGGQRIIVVQSQQELDVNTAVWNTTEASKLDKYLPVTTTTEVSLTHKLPNATIATLSTPEPPNAKTEPISPPESQHTRSETSESTITVTSPSSSRKPDTTTKPKALGEVKAATSDSSRVIIIVSVIGGLCIVAAMATAYFFIKKRKKDTTSNEQKESNESLAPSETSQTSSIIEDKDKVDNGEIEGDDDEEEEDENNERRVHWDI